MNLAVLLSVINFLNEFNSKYTHLFSVLFDQETRKWYTKERRTENWSSK